MQNKISVLIVDEYPIVRLGLRELLASRMDIDIIGETESIADAVSLAKYQKPDVVILGDIPPDSTDINMISEFAKIGSTRILAFCGNDSWDRVEVFINAGGSGFTTKRAPLDEILGAVYAVANDRQWISPSLRIARKSVNYKSNKDDKLSAREREIASLIASGLTSKQIADQLSVSLKTIESHRYRIFKKLNIRHSASLVEYAIINGLKQPAIG